MNPILHKTLALTLSASLLNAYAVPAFSAETISADKTITGETFKNETGNPRGGVFALKEPAAWDANIRGDMVVNIKDSHFTNNSTSAGGYGGTIFQYTGTLNIDNTTFTGNTADWDGGAISTVDPTPANRPDGAGKLVVKNSTFDSNTATVYSAGAIGLYSEGEISNSTFTNNKAGGHDPADATDGGGALYLGGWAQATLKGNLFEGNSSNRGGAIGTTAGGISQYAYLHSTGDTFKNNTATKFGGAIFNQFATANNYVNDATFTGNKADKYGGAIYNSGVLTVNNSNFTTNTADAGGAIFNANKAVLNLEGNNTFADNTANGVANDIHNDGTLNINSGTTTLAGGITGNGALNVKGSSVLNLGQATAEAGNTAIGVANDIYNDGTLNINSGTITLAGGITGNGALNVKGSSVLNLGQATAEAGSIAFDNGATLAVEFGNNGKGNLKANTITIGENASDSAKLLVTFSRGSLTDDTTPISHELTNGTDVKNGSFAMADASNALYNVTFDNNIVTAVRKTQEETNKEIANAGGNANNANVINAFTNSSDMGSDAANQTADVINRLAQTDVSAAVAATNAVAPEAASAKQVVHGSIAREVFNSLQTRMDTASNAAPQAFALDDEQKVQKQGSYSVWMQGLLNKSHKEAADTTAFTGSSTGLAFGADTAVNDDILLGAGYAYTHTNVSSDGRHDRILGDNFFVYGQYRPSRFYVQASLGYGDSKYEEAKYLPGLNVNADYHVKSYSAQATAGYELTDMFTPTLGLRYINLQQEGYKDSADQAVSAEQNSYLSGVLGVTLKNEVYASSALRLLPQLHAGLSYDFVSDNAQGNVVLPNGSNYSISGERLHRLGFEAGASVSAYLSDNWEALLGYEGNFRQDYNSHTGTLKVRYLF